MKTFIVIWSPKTSKKQVAFECVAESKWEALKQLKRLKKRDSYTVKEVFEKK